MGILEVIITLGSRLANLAVEAIKNVNVDEDELAFKVEQILIEGNAFLEQFKQDIIANDAAADEALNKIEESQGAK